MEKYRELHENFWSAQCECNDGQEMQESKWEYLMGSRMGYLSNAATDLTLGDAATAKNNGNSGESSILSYFGRLFYSYDDKYLLTFTLRRDGSSKFYKDNRWGWFPSAALAWKVSNESFLKDNNIINNLKLRLGWGVVGNQNVPNNAIKPFIHLLLPFGEQDCWLAILRIPN